MSLLRKCRVPLMGGLAAVLFTTAATAGGVAGYARKGIPVSVRLQEGTHIRAPFALIRHCIEDPQACRGGGSDTMEWTADIKSLVLKTNLQVNRKIRPVNDRGDTWSSNVSSGDCEDFALTKRQALVRAGLPASALRMATARTSSGEGHAVLVIKTSEGDFVLDNRTNRVTTWNQTDLTFIKIATGENPRIWRSLL